MTKREENQQSSNAKFKINLTKKETVIESLQPEIDKLKLGKGLYAQLKSGNKVNYSSLSLSEIEKGLRDMFTASPKSSYPSQRNVKLYTTASGMEIFNKAIKEEALKMIKNEHRKKFSFRSKIFKQAYKFR